MQIAYGGDTPVTQDCERPDRIGVLVEVLKALGTPERTLLYRTVQTHLATWLALECFALSARSAVAR